MSSGFQLAAQQAEGYESFTRTFMDGSAQLIVDSAEIEPGDVILDLACGTGLVARHALSLVGPSGRVVGADINPAMLGVARRSVGDGVEWVEAPCEVLPFEDAAFTHVICQQGFQFFPEPAAAMLEVFRVLRPRGVLLATVWATPGHNPYIETQLHLLATVDPKLLPVLQRASPPDADEFLRSIAESAGFVDATVTLLEHTVQVADLETWFLSQTASTPWGPTLATLTDAERQRLASALTGELDAYATQNGGHTIPFGSHRLAAYRPQ